MLMDVSQDTTNKIIINNCYHSAPVICAIKLHVLTRVVIQLIIVIVINRVITIFIAIICD